MNKNRIWYIPAAFFAVCCILNLTGCLDYSSNALERAVKPALMPLLCITTLAFLLQKGALLPGTALLVCGQLFGFAGDTMLMGKGFPFFAGGIGLFLTGHIFYICLFGGQSWKGLKPWQWAAAIAVMLGGTAALALGIGVNGVMLGPMGVYGFVLMMLIFSGLAGVLRPGAVKGGSRCTWWIILCGALLFTFSDALIAVRNFGNLSPFMSGFGVMSTYLAAQTLLAVGGVRLIRNK
ncbi:MAG: lysoplasmalogenase [Bacteroidales bacterium]|nr:lysoplasmalogenase [Bacteroidales bacterium]